MTPSVFLIVAFLTDTIGALQTPTLSLFLTSKVHVRPAMVDFSFTGSVVINTLVSQLLVGCSDRRGDCRQLIVVCCLLGVLACLLFAWNRNYFILLFTDIFLSSSGPIANPQMFALTREHVDKTGCGAVMFSSTLRARVSLAWVIGSPLACTLAIGFGFTTMCLGAAAMFIICGIIVWLSSPNIHKTAVVATGRLEAPCTYHHDVLLLFSIYMLIWGTDNLYIINMPLSIINELHLPEKLAGLMMGAAVGLETPTMLIAGYYARRFSKRFLMRLSTAAGVLFYVGMLMVYTPVLLLAVQVLNAIYIGILAEIGMLYFQDLMPGQTGVTTTLYTNTTRVGWITADPLAGVVAEIWSRHVMFWIALVMGIIAQVCLWRTRNVQVRWLGLDRTVLISDPDRGNAVSWSFVTGLYA